jgi:hypothetical protein
VRQIGAVSRRRSVVRPHPGRFAPVIPLEDQLDTVGAVAVWASRVGIEALLAGVPVIAWAPFWVGAAAAETDTDRIDDPRRGDREAMFARLAWAQWRIGEVTSGDAIASLLHRAGQETRPICS